MLKPVRVAVERKRKGEKEVAEVEKKETRGRKEQAKSTLWRAKKERSEAPRDNAKTTPATPKIRVALLPSWRPRARS